jgi:phage-related protein (TIGR01555 family)
MTGIIESITKAFPALRLDGWSNVLTGLGYSMRDKTLASRFTAGRKLSASELDDLYHHEDLAASICDRLPEEMMRGGFTVTQNDGEVADDVMQRWEELGAYRAFLDAQVWARVFGGAAVYMIVDDGSQREAEPLGERYRKIDALEVIDCRELLPATYYEDTRHPKFGQPATYNLTRVSAAATAQTNIEIHESRLVIFGGARTSRRRRIGNNSWDDSVLQRCETVLNKFHMSWDGAAYLMSDMSQAVFKVRDLINTLASQDADAEKSLMKRLELVEMSRSVARAVVVDAEMEEFERKATPLTGVDSMLRLFMLRLSSAARMPVTILFAQEPAGLNATGESDMTWWYDSVAARQMSELKPRLKQFFGLLWGEEGRKPPKSWDITFNPLWSPTAKEQAEIRKLTSEADAIDIKSEVLTPAEVATSRFTARGWSPETTIDLDAREQIKEAELQRKIEMAENPPEPPVAVPPSGGLPVPGPEAD